MSENTTNREPYQQAYYPHRLHALHAHQRVVAAVALRRHQLEDAQAAGQFASLIVALSKMNRLHVDNMQPVLI